jgi:D-alanine-D-alanine ligase
MNINYTADSTTLAMTLDKALAKKIVHQAGVLTPKFILFESGKEKLPHDITFPLIIKPVAEGSSKGVVPKSIVHTEQELREVAKQIISRYKQAAIAEEFLVGREFTVALIGEKRVKVLPPMEIVFNTPDDKYPIYSYKYKLNYSNEIRYECPPLNLDPRLRARLESEARKSFTALGCRDFARIDFRLDAMEVISLNVTLPGSCPGWSDMYYASWN